MELEKQTWSEQALMELLGVTRKQLDNLRLEKGLPTVHLNRKVRIYFGDEVLKFLEDIRGRSPLGYQIGVRGFEPPTT